MNDLTSDQTKKESAEELKKLGLEKAMSEYKGTGMVYFFNAETGELITKISVARSDEELARAIMTASEGA